VQATNSKLRIPSSRPPTHPALPNPPVASHHRQGMDCYSNILYVKEQFAALSHLAHRVAATDRYRPESCCIIGNYYSLKVRITD